MPFPCRMRGVRITEAGLSGSLAAGNEDAEIALRSDGEHCGTFIAS
jgi:hypothetical protein